MSPRLSYNPANWYWTVQDRSPGTQVYSSAVVGYVALTDATYVSWLAAGGRTTTIAFEQDLFDLLSAAGVSLPGGSSTSDATKNSLFDAIPQAVKVWAFAIENRVRVLEGQPTRSPAQFKNYVKSLMT
jgi:hypothetical protein